MSECLYMLRTFVYYFYISLIRARVARVDRPHSSRNCNAFVFPCVHWPSAVGLRPAGQKFIPGSNFGQRTGNDIMLHGSAVTDQTVDCATRSNTELQQSNYDLLNLSRGKDLAHTTLSSKRNEIVLRGLFSVELKAEARKLTWAISSALLHKARLWHEPDCFFLWPIAQSLPLFSVPVRSEYVEFSKAPHISCSSALLSHLALLFIPLIDSGTSLFSKESDWILLAGCQKLC